MMKMIIRTKRTIAALLCAGILLTGMPVYALEDAAPAPEAQNSETAPQTPAPEAQNSETAPQTPAPEAQAPADEAQSAESVLPAPAPAAPTLGIDVKTAYAETGAYILAHTPNPIVGSIGGEWAVFGLARAGYPVGTGFTEKYIANLVQTLTDKKGVLDKRKYTEYSRVTLALTAIGYDVTEIAGYNMLAPLADFNQTIWQGINGGIFALLAFDSHGYEIPTAPAGKEQTTRENLIAFILSKEIAGGGWALSGKVPDPDISAMAMQSLAPYYADNADVKAAVGRALDKMSAAQTATGGYGSWGTVNAESCAQMLTALTALGIDPLTDARFIKNGCTIIDAILSYYVEGGGFKHTATGDVNGMATEQCYYALAAYFRFLEGKTALYDMSDVKINAPYQTVMEMIAAIGTVTLDTAVSVNGVRTAYEALSAEHKAKVKNYSLLQAAETEAESLLKNLRATEKQIAALGSVTLENKDKILAAKAAYDALSDKEKALVSNHDTLSRALTQLDMLQKAQSVIQLIDEIGNVTKDSGEKITAARTAFNALNSFEQALVTNAAKLIEAEKLFSKMIPGGGTKVIGAGQAGITIGGKNYIVDKKSAEVIKALDKIPQNTALSEENVVDLFKTYQALTDKQKGEIINFAALETQMNHIATENQTDKESGMVIEGAEWNIKLNVQPAPISSKEAEALKENLGSHTMLLLFNIHLTDILTNESYTPNTPLTIKMPLPPTIENHEAIVIAHYKEDGTVEYIDCSVIDGQIVWQVTSFSYYAVVNAAAEAAAALPQESETATALPEANAEAPSVYWLCLWAALALAGFALLGFALYAKKRADDK